MNRCLAALLFAASMLLTACQGALNHEPGSLQVTLALEGDELELVESRELEDSDRTTDDHDHDHDHDGEGVRYIFRPNDGAPAVEGTVPDTRVLRSEFDESGQPDPREVLANNGIFRVNVPEAAGQLDLQTPDGRLLGSVEVDPDQPVARRSMLVGDGDILGPPVKILNNGPSNSKVDILFLPEGYTQNEMRQFHRHVANISSGLAVAPGYRDHWDGFNLLRLDVRSRSGRVGAGGRPADTAFETASGISGLQRCVFFANSRGQAAAESIGRQVGADVIVVLVNSTSHGGCARDGVVVSTRSSNVADIIAHELGHALFGLRDEYETPRSNGQCGPSGPNVATSPNNLPWANMVNTNQIPTSSNARRGTIGAFEGAGYCSRGRYRPTHDCMMRSLGTDFCPVCQRHIARTMAPYTGRSAATATNPPTGGGSSSGTSSGSTSGGSSSPSAPAGLSPDLTTVDNTEVGLSWNSVRGATMYRLSVEREANGRWQSFGSAETSGTAARVNIRPESGRYRWSAQACNSSGCTKSLDAIFTYSGSTASGSTSATTSGGSSGGSSTSGSSGGVPGVPGNLKPADQTAIADGTPSISWNSTSGATHYMFKMVYRQSEGNWPTYVPAQRIDGTRISTTLNTPEIWYAFAVQSCNASGCSNWSEYSRFYYRP